MHTLVIVQGGLVFSFGVNDEGALGREAAKEVENAESTPGLITMPGRVHGAETPRGCGVWGVW
jgi:regulator of chromosome condensation